MKKLLIFVLSVIMFMTLTACKANEEKEDIDNDESVEVQTNFYLDYENKYDNSKPIYVIGHLSPDTDTVCSAIAFANFLNKMGYEAIPAITAEPNAETNFVLEKFNMSIPKVLNEASNNQFILVDHNDTNQSLSGMDKATVLGVLDHHNVGNFTSDDPIMYVAMPVGCTSTIVYKMYKDYNVAISKEMAGMMLSAILSDTKDLRSTTTTDYDIQVVGELVKIAEVDDYDAYAKEMFNAGNILDTLTIEQILKYDYKEYESGTTKFSIGVVQSADDEQLLDIENDLNEYMNDNFNSLNVDQCYIMMSNQLTLETKLLCYGQNALETAKKAFNAEGDDIILENTTSRKKQVAPVLIEFLATKN